MRVYKSLTEEQKLKRSITMKGRPKTMAHRRAISLGMQTSPNTVRTPEWNANIGKAVSKTRRLQRPRIYLTGPIKFEKVTVKLESTIRTVRKQPILRDIYLDRFESCEKEIPMAVSRDYSEESRNQLVALLG